MIDTSFLLALTGAVLGAASMVLHVVAPRTKTPIDDELRDDLDEVLAFIRGQQSPGTAAAPPPASSPSSTAPPPASPPSATSKAGSVATVALLAVALGGGALAPACANPRSTTASGAWMVAGSTVP